MSIKTDIKMKSNIVKNIWTFYSYKRSEELTMYVVHHVESQDF